MSREFNVLVTGFGANHDAPYGNNTSNPAGTVAFMMPESLRADHPLNKTGGKINFVDPVKGNFGAIPGIMGTIRQRVIDLHAEHGTNIDVWIHLGRGPWEFVSCERLAFRQDFSSAWLQGDAHKAYYTWIDRSGTTVHDIGPHPWGDVPMGLMTELDVDSVVSVANENLRKESATREPLEVRSHLEGGNFGCGFIYYEGMANCYKAGKKRDVLFCHIPRHEEKEYLERTRDAILAIVGASIVAKVKRDATPPGDPKQEFGNIR